MEEFAGRQWHYDFRQLNAEFSDASCASVASRLLQRYARITREWNPQRNSEWICRLYLASKLVMSSTLHVNAAYYSEDRNLRVVIPYLRYYAVLSLMRAVCLTLPECEWNNGEIIQLSHARTINTTLDHLRQFDRNSAQRAESEIRELKAERELLSYRAPSTGDDQVASKNNFLQLCVLLAEVAQFNSELFEASLRKNAERRHFEFLPDYAAQLASVEIDGHYFGDREDAYRLDYLSRKQPYPVNLQAMMKEGHVEDFFGAWSALDERAGLFDPDEGWGLIFDIP